ncbi:MAG: FAD-binding oxidoreductase [Streptosporangiaceae bacterium]|nr:FAD-binding oxidoreductase [Streptosporangiaceae bacterium]
MASDRETCEVEPTARRKFWGWGLEGEGLSAAEIEQLGAAFAGRFGIGGMRVTEPPRVEELELPAPRLAPPGSLAAAFSADPYDRAAHTYGRSLRDLVRAFRRDYAHAPDLVAFPCDEAELVSVLEWCGGTGAAAIPFGGGSSVVGGVEPDVGDGYRGAVSVDLRRLAGVLDVDRTSRAARIAAGTLGPAVEAQLKPHGLTLRHFPQSFEWSTLGGWIATRSGGHFATLHTHIDEFVEAVRVVTPRGVLQTRRLPASGAGPSAERLFCGSEGTLGVITQAWMRVQPRPRFRAGASVSFAGLADAVAAAREVAQSGLDPANCRLLGHEEALLSGAGDGSQAILVLGFESADHELGPWLARALDICASHHGEARDSERDPAAVWRAAFLRGPHLRDALTRLGVVHETFETAITWDRFWDFHEGVLAAAAQAVRRACGGGAVSCRFAYVYPDGPAPYYSVFAPGRPGQELEQWDEIKLAASEAIAALGGTITHHHAVGRDHRPWYLREVPQLFAAALRSAKAELDPSGIMNPGVLLPPTRTVSGQDTPVGRAQPG